MRRERPDAFGAGAARAILTGWKEGALAIGGTCFGGAFACLKK